ncbi:MAG: nitrilase [Spirochaetes bacterium]|nr:nitrilase [Spirochaetota bacterium]
MKIWLAQINPKFLDLEKNFLKSIKILKKIDNGIVIFPELYLSGYNFSTKEEVEKSSLTIDNDYFKEYKNITKKKEIAICGGFAEKDNNKKIYNSSFFIANGEIINIYRKTHLFSREKLFFEKGNTGFNVFEYKKVKIGMMICFDWYFPEAARTLAIKGAQVILHPSNLVLPYCQRALFTRALENKVFIACCNRIGKEKENQNNIILKFSGRSTLVSPDGKYLLYLPKNRESIKCYDINPEQALDKNITKLNNFLEDRRPNYYEIF